MLSLVLWSLPCQISASSLRGTHNRTYSAQCAALGSDVGTFAASIRQVASFANVVKCTPADRHRVRADSPFHIQSASSMLRLGGHVLSEDSVQTLRHCRCRYDSGVFDVSEVVEMWGYHELPRMAVTTISSIGQAICARRVTSIVLHRSWTALRGLFGNWPGPLQDCLIMTRMCLMLQWSILMPWLATSVVLQTSFVNWCKKVAARKHNVLQQFIFWMLWLML